MRKKGQRDCQGVQYFLVSSSFGLFLITSNSHQTTSSYLMPSSSQTNPTQHPVSSLPTPPKYFISRIVFSKLIYLDNILMRSMPFHRNHQENLAQPLKKSKNIRLSVDNASSISKTPLFLKKQKRRSVNQSSEKKLKQTITYNRSKNLISATTKNSMNATKTNSPFKMSKTNSQVQLPLINSIKNYKFYYQIGFGAFGRVWKVADKETGKQFALKEISKQKVLEKCNVSSVLNQRIILSHLNNPFIVNIANAFQDDSNLFLTMDYIRGADLRYHICYKQHFNEKQIRKNEINKGFIAACLVLALEYVHANNVIHRDIKPQNILFEENGYIRLTDFGIAKFRTQENNPSKSEASGTPVYMAPEILFRRDFSLQSDYYALGVVLFELALGKRPYAGKTRSQIRQELMNREICLSEFQLSTKLSPELISLINKLLKKNPAQRLGKNGAKQLKQHAFFKQIKWSKLYTKQLKPPFIPNVVCETQGYLNEISLFNEMNQQNKENVQRITSEINRQFEEYDYCKEEGKGLQKKVKGLMKKNRRGSQGRINF